MEKRNEIVSATSDAKPAEVVRMITEEDLREAIRRAYEDAARIVMEERSGLDPIAATFLAERIQWRGEPECPSERGHGLLPGERLTCHARGMHPIPKTVEELAARGGIPEAR